MHIVVKADDLQKEIILLKGIPDGVKVTWFSGDRILNIADAYFDLHFETDGPAFDNIKDTPVFINAVITPAKELPGNCIRLNGWNGFLERSVIEVAVFNEGIKENANAILNTLEWQHEWVPDEPGMIAARVIAMIINEAYFGLGDGISTKAEIDIAMKLGTNYPLGPFEWAEKIGLRKIYQLLQKLSKKDSRYAIAPAMEKEIMF